MNSKRLYFTLLVVIFLLAAGLVSGAYEADKLLQGQSNKLVNDRLQTAVLAQQQIALSEAKQDIKKYQVLSNIAKSIVPQDKDQAQTVREIVNLANENGIILGSVNFPTSSLGAGPNGKTTTSPQLSQLVPVPGIAGVYSLAITVESDPNHVVPYGSFIDFLTALEHNRRTALVTGITIQPNEKDRSKLSFTLILNEYIKP